LGEVRENLVILDDPLVHIMGDGARTPIVSATLDLKLRALLL
jgi:hypothetical protein